MNQKTRRGIEIYLELKEVEEENKELGRAADMVADEVGQGSLPHRVLIEQYKKSEEKLRELKNREYQF